MSQLQHRNKNQIFIVFKFIKKMKWHLRYTNLVVVEINYQRKKTGWNSS